MTASGNSKGAIECLRQEMANDEYVNALIDAGDAPAVAKYAFGVRR